MVENTEDLTKLLSYIRGLDPYDVHKMCVDLGIIEDAEGNTGAGIISDVVPLDPPRRVGSYSEEFKSLDSSFQLNFLTGQDFGVGGCIYLNNDSAGAPWFAGFRTWAKLRQHQLRFENDITTCSFSQQLTDNQKDVLVRWSLPLRVDVLQEILSELGTRNAAVLGNISREALLSEYFAIVKKRATKGRTL